MMTDARVMSIDELKAFLASSDVLTFKGNLTGKDLRLKQAHFTLPRESVPHTQDSQRGSKTKR